MKRFPSFSSEGVFYPPISPTVKVCSQCGHPRSLHTKASLIGHQNLKDRMFNTIERAPWEECHERLYQHGYHQITHP
jgi:hypothetical protein